MEPPDFIMISKPKPDTGFSVDCADTPEISHN